MVVNCVRKPRKLSKSDQPQTPEAAQAERDFFANRPTSQHFAVGTYVIYRNCRYEVVACWGDVVVLSDDKGECKVLNRPYFMQWR